MDCAGLCGGTAVNDDCVSESATTKTRTIHNYIYLAFTIR
jgi:hypothetical protein